MKPQTTPSTTPKQPQFGRPVSGRPLNIGAGFEALSFKHDQFDGLMDPLVMLDHYTMSESTFGAHPHAGMSAVSILFEDSKGVFNNRDSLGNDLDLLPGDVYWLKAGSGAVHDEKPSEGSRTHGIQMFVNLPRHHKTDAPSALHLPTKSIPAISGEGYRVRVLLGKSNGTQGATPPALPFTALDAYLETGGVYSHQVDGHQSLLVYAISGDVQLNLGNQDILLREQQAIAIQLGETAEQLRLSSNNKAHFVALHGSPIREKFIQKGPFVMSNTHEIDRVTAAYEAGLLGSIPA